MRFPVAVVVLALVSGCTGSPMEQPSPSDESPDSNSPLNSLRLNNCQGLYFASVAPSSQRPSPPEGWAQNEIPATEVRVEVHQCERIKLGNLERGPVSLLIESHNNRETPTGCKPPYAENANVASLLIVDDPNVALAMSSLGLPVENGTFSWSMDGAVLLGVEFGTVSPYSRLRDLGPANADNEGTSTTRFAWTNSFGGVSVVDLKEEVRYDAQSSGQVLGEFYSPTLMAQLGYPAVLGRGGIYVEGQLVGSMFHYGDAKCEVPLA